MIKPKDRMQAKPIIDPAAMRAIEWKVMPERTGVIARSGYGAQQCLSKMGY